MVAKSYGQSSGHINIGHINAQSLSPHMIDIQNTISTYNIHVMGISESWLTPESTSRSVNIHGYVLYRNDRKTKRGGGVAMYVSSTLKSRLVTVSDDGESYIRKPEFLGVEIFTKSYKILCVVIYNPPRTNSWSELLNSIMDIQSGYDSLILMGDLNTDWKTASASRNSLESLLYTFALNVIPFDATHRLDNSSTTIDYICTTNLDLLSHFSQHSCPSISKHDILIISLSLSGVADNSFITFRDRSTFNCDDFLTDLNHINWNAIFLEPDINIKVSMFNDLLLGIYNQHAPFKTITRKRKSPQWLSREIMNLISERNKIYRKFRRLGREQDGRTYRTLRNRIKCMVRNARFSYFYKKFSNCNGNSASLWKAVDELGVSGKSDCVTSLPVHANELNKFFIGNFYSSTNPTLTFTVDNPDKLFYFAHVGVDDIMKALFRTRSNASGPDGIPVGLLKECLPVILPILLHIFDVSLQSCMFPDVWKHALIRPIVKKKPALQAQDFRPISILCAVSKVLESVAFSQMQDFITDRNLFDNQQSGFRKNHSTHTALIKIIDDFKEGIDNGRVTLMVSIDFKQAFDCVNITLLVDKLNSLGFSLSACKWVKSYLTNRTQVVADPQGGYSCPMSRTAGVPQGSILGPPLFSLFINDLPNCLHYCNYHLYADDFVIYNQCDFNNVHDAVREVNEDLSSICSWASSNSFSINTDKTKAMWIGNRSFIHRLNNLNLPHVCFGGATILPDSTLKLLGIHIDSSLTFAHQYSAISRKTYAALNRLKKCSDAFPRNVKALLTKSLVLPHFDYCMSLYLGLAGEFQQKMQRLMNSALRFISGKRKYDHISQEFLTYDVMPFSKRTQFVALSLLAKILTTSEPRYLAECLTFRPANAPGSRRVSAFDLQVKFCSTSMGQSAFVFCAVKLWNNLPSVLRSYYNRPCFKNRLRLFLKTDF